MQKGEYEGEGGGEEGSVRASPKRRARGEEEREEMER